MYGVYGALTALAWAAVLPYQTLMAFLKRRPRPPLRERLGHPPPGARPGGFWLHAVSVGQDAQRQPHLPDRYGVAPAPARPGGGRGLGGRRIGRGGAAGVAEPSPGWRNRRQQ